MAYLPGVEVNHDHEGGSSRMRLSHCTSGQLTPTMVSNVDHLNAQFLLVGDCVRAIPQIMKGRGVIEKCVKGAFPSCQKMMERSTLEQ